MPGLPLRLLLVLGLALPLFGQKYSLKTVVGQIPPKVSTTAAASVVLQPEAVLADAFGNTYIADALGHRVVKIDSKGNLTVVAGTGLRGTTPNDGKPANTVALSMPSGLALDGEGNLYFTDRDAALLRKVDTKGIITTLAGIGGVNRYCGDGRPAVDACLSAPRGLAFGPDGNLYIADTGSHRVRKIDMTTGIITTVAGVGVGGFTADGVKAILSRLNAPEDVAFGPLDGYLYIADTGNHRIRVVKNGIISTYAGTGKAGANYDGHIAKEAEVASPAGVVFSNDGTLYFTDRGTTASTAAKLRMVNSSTGVLSTIYSYAVEADPNNLNQGQPCRITINSAGKVLWTDANSRNVYGFTPEKQAQNQKASVQPLIGASVTALNGPATDAVLINPVGLAVDSNGNLFVSDDTKHQVYRVDAETGNISLYAGSGVKGNLTETQTSAPMQAKGARMNQPSRMAVDLSGNLYIADARNNRIRKVTASTGVFQTVAGGGSSKADGVLAFYGAPPNTKNAIFPTLPSASLNTPRGVAVDASGNIYIADTGNHVVRMVDVSDGTIRTIAGTMSTTGQGGDGGLATQAYLNSPYDVAVDTAGNIYIADSVNSCVRVVTGGYIFLVSGMPGQASHDASSATRKAWTLRNRNVWGIDTDAKGYVWIADSQNNNLRRYDPNTGLEITLLGTGNNTSNNFDGADATFTYTGPTPPSTAPYISFINDVAVDNNTGTVYMSLQFSGVVRALIPQ